ncbi:MAG: DUF1848 domain-containing protein [Candidatus Marinimicrobia bacterium]|nr:DUF1848 domain-containing protein [Candidatus Neomarinimicrobiota bacterium]
MKDKKIPIFPHRNNETVKNIISASRRTDLPAFHGRDFLAAVRSGFVDVPNPFSGKNYRVSLAPADVAAIVFWSRNYEPFFPILDKIREKYQDRFVFHFTITGYENEAKQILEPRVPDTKKSIQTLQRLAEKYGSEKIFWRFDPIIFSNLTPPKERLRKFSALCAEISGFVNRCYFSFIDLYKKVERRLERYQEALKLDNPKKSGLYEFSDQLQKIARQHQLPLFSCCEEKIVENTGITQGHCVDAPYLSKLFPSINFSQKVKPTRKDCGCYSSRDIGQYDTCQYDCLYCYANK